MLIAAVLLLTLGGLLTWRMANELQVTQTFNYVRGNAALARAITGQYVNVSSDPIIYDVLAVTTAEIAIPLGGVTISSSWAWFRNLDATNFIELRVSTGSTKFARLKPGEGLLIRLGSGITAPYAIADTATCSMEYALFSA